MVGLRRQLYARHRSRCSDRSAGNRRTIGPRSFCRASGSSFLAMNRALSSKEEPALTRQAFDRLLACFDSDRDRAGEKYENLRCKLVKFFEWRACAVAAEDLTDETINRIARRVDEGEIVRNLSNYAYGVARMVYLERMKEVRREEAA